MARYWLAGILQAYGPSYRPGLSLYPSICYIGAMETVYWDELFPTKLAALESMGEGDSMFFPDQRPSDLSWLVAYARDKFAQRHGTRAQFSTRIERCLITGDLRGTWVICRAIDFG